VEIGRILIGLRDLAEQEVDEDLDEEEAPSSPLLSTPSGGGPAQAVSAYEAAIVQSLRGGQSHGEAEVLRAALVHIGRQKLGPKIREDLIAAAQQLVHKGMIGIEEGEYFLTPRGRSAELRIRYEPKPVRTRSTRGRSYNSSYRRRSSTYRRRRY
jgi:hypothetical protein